MRWHFILESQIESDIDLHGKHTMHLKKKFKLQWMCSESHCCRRGCVHDPIVVVGVFNVPLLQWVCSGSNCCSGCVQYPIVTVGMFRIQLLLGVCSISHCAVGVFKIQLL